MTDGGNHMELFKTERTIIQSFNSEYINDFMTYHNNDEWMQFQGFKNLTRAEYETELLKDFSLEEGSQLAIIKKDINLLVGDIFLKEVTNSLFVGYTISPKFSKQGYATEVLLGIIDWAKQKTFSDISAYVELQNEGVRISLNTKEMITGVLGFEPENRGDKIELAFLCDSKTEVDEMTGKIRDKGYTVLKEPWSAPWGQYYSLVRDVDNNIISLFVNE